MPAPNVAPVVVARRAGGNAAGQSIGLYFLASVFNAVSFSLYCVAVAHAQWSVFTYGNGLFEADLGVTEVCIKAIYETDCYSGE